MLVAYDCRASGARLWFEGRNEWTHLLFSPVGIKIKIQVHNWSMYVVLDCENCEKSDKWLNSSEYS